VRARILVPFAVIVAVLLAAYWLVWVSPDALIAPGVRAGDGVGSAPRSSLAAKAPPPATQASRNAKIAPAGTGAPSLRNRFLETRDLYALYASLDNMLDVPLAERLLYKAVILDSCANYANVLKDAAPGIKEMIERGVEMKAAPSGNANDPRVKTAAAYLRGRNTVALCRGFDGAITRADVDKAYAQAAAAGSPAAQARMIERRLVDEGTRGDLPPGVPATNDSRNMLVRPAQLTAQEQQQLLNALLSGDPVAIVEAGHVLSIGSERQVVRVNGASSDPGPYGDYEYMLAACEFGFECGAENLMVSRFCASRGQCSDDLGMLLRDYMIPPADFALVEANARALANAIRAGQMGLFHVVDRNGPFFRLVSEPGTVQIH
jgi:hypothetical protein